MTTLYRPVQITSAEQALSMPGETVFIGEAGARYDHRGDGRLRDHNGVDMATDLGMSREVTALVPIEVEEETAPGTDMRELNLHATKVEMALLAGETIPVYDGGRRTRLVTPWEVS